jgi:hypothetical protein
MYANLYGNPRYRPHFADFRVNLRDGTTGIFACQRERNNHESTHMARRVKFAVIRLARRSARRRLSIDG